MLLIRPLIRVQWHDINDKTKQYVYSTNDMPWLVCGDFNEIVHLDQKMGWKDRDAAQIDAFREVLSKCGLIDLGFVGPRFT